MPMFKITSVVKTESIFEVNISFMTFLSWKSYALFKKSTSLCIHLSWPIFSETPPVSNYFCYSFPAFLSKASFCGRKEHSYFGVFLHFLFSSIMFTLKTHILWKAIIEQIDSIFLINTFFKKILTTIPALLFCLKSILLESLHYTRLRLLSCPFTFSFSHLRIFALSFSSSSLSFLFEFDP